MKMRHPVVVLGLVGSLMWLGAGAFAPDQPARAAASPPGMEVPIPGNYPGGASSPRFQADARRFHAGMNAYLEDLEADAAAGEAGIMSEMLSGMGSALMIAAAGLGVAGVIRKRRLLASAGAEASHSAPA